MSVRFNLVIRTENGVSFSDFMISLNRLDQLVRSASIDVIYRIGAEYELPLFIIEAAAWRTLTSPDGLLWIERIERGSINIKAIFLSAVVSMSITSTIGESVKEGWKETTIHHTIKDAIPKIEHYVVQDIERLLSPKDRPIEPESVEFERSAITRREDGDWEISIEIRPRRKEP